MQAVAPPRSAAPAGRNAWRRAAPIACGCALAGAAALVAGLDPAAPGSRFPACQFRVLTAWWSWFRSSRGHPRVQAPSWTMRATAVGLPAALLVYGVLRNIPFAPFTALAP